MGWERGSGARGGGIGGSVWGDGNGAGVTKGAVAVAEAGDGGEDVRGFAKGEGWDEGGEVQGCGRLQHCGRITVWEGGS